MNRRGFLRALLTGTVGLIAGAELDLDRLLWVPGAKTIFLPPPAENFDVWMTREVLRLFDNNLKFTRAINREYSDRFDIGDQLNIRLPQRFA